MNTLGLHRALRRAAPWTGAVVLALGGVARAERSVEPETAVSGPSGPSPDPLEDRTSSSTWIAVEGGWAHPLLDVSAYTPGDAYVGTTVPFRLDVGLRLADHLWLAPFLSIAWVQGVSTYGPADDGFRMLLGGELQLHSALRDENFDYFGGLGLAFERLVAHTSFGGCGHCSPDSASLIGNGANLELRVGILVRFARFLRIGPYVGAQLSWLPGIAPVDVVPPDLSTGQPGGTFKNEISPFQLWFDVGLRVVFLL